MTEIRCQVEGCSSVLKVTEQPISKNVTYTCYKHHGPIDLPDRARFQSVQFDPNIPRNA